MTTAAWIMLAATWGVVGFVAGRFFWMVLRAGDRQRRPRAAVVRD